MAEITKANETEWQRVQVYLPQDFYEILQARSKRRGTSLSAEAFRLMRLGLANVKPNENVETILTDMARYIQLHLEPLAFVAAMDSAYDAASWHRLWSTTPAGKNPQDLEKLEHHLREQAIKRLQRKLHELPGEDDPEDEEEE